MAAVPEPGRAPQYRPPRPPSSPYGALDYAKSRLAAQNYAVYSGFGAQPMEPPAPSSRRARANVARAFANRPVGGSPNPGAVVDNPETMPALDPTKGLLMTYAAPGTPNAGQPIYYGTQEARDLAIAGLQRVLHGYGPGSTKFAQALAAASGVLGPQYQNLLDPYRLPTAPGHGAVMP